METVLFRDTKKTLEVSPIAFNFQYSNLSVKSKNRLSGGLQAKRKSAHKRRLFKLFLVIFILIKGVYSKSKKMSTGDIFFENRL